MGECAGGKALDDLRLEWPVLLLFAAADLQLAHELWWQMGPMTQHMPVCSWHVPRRLSRDLRYGLFFDANA